MKPQPLIWVLPHPAFNHGRDHLRRLLHIDPATGVARQIERTLGRDAEAVVRQADYAHTDHGAVELAGEARQAGEGVAGAVAEPG